MTFSTRTLSLKPCKIQGFLLEPHQMHWTQLHLYYMAPVRETAFVDLRIVLLLFETFVFLCVVQQTGKALVLKQWGQGADKALSKQFPGCQEVSWAHSGPCTQSPMSAMSPENLLCNFKICLPFPGRVLLSHLGKHFHWLPSPYWKICKMFAYFWQWF